MICSRNVSLAIAKGLVQRSDIEKIAIGTALCFDECWQKAKPLIRDIVFSDARNKFLWGLLTEMKSNGLDVDVDTMWQYAMDKYPNIKDPSKLAAYICEVTLVVCYADYDKVISELFRLYTTEIRK